MWGGRASASACSHCRSSRLDARSSLLVAATIAASARSSLKSVSVRRLPTFAVARVAVGARRYSSLRRSQIVGCGFEDCGSLI